MNLIKLGDRIINLDHVQLVQPSPGGAWLWIAGVEASVKIDQDEADALNWYMANKLDVPCVVAYYRQGTEEAGGDPREARYQNALLLLHGDGECGPGCPQCEEGEARAEMEAELTDPMHQLANLDKPLTIGETLPATFAPTVLSQIMRERHAAKTCGWGCPECQAEREGQEAYEAACPEAEPIDQERLRDIWYLVYPPTDE